MKERSVPEKTVNLSSGLVLSMIKNLSAERYPFPASHVFKGKPPNFISRVAEVLNDTLLNFKKYTD